LRASLSAAREWAVKEFGGAKLGRVDAVRRLVQIAESFADDPGAIIAAAVRQGKDREGAYRFMESDLATDAIASSSFNATLARTRGAPYAFVPIDGTSLQVRDAKRTKGTGPIGARNIPTRGFQIMSSLVVTPEGVPQGLCALSWWSRGETAPKRESSKRKLEEKETKYWLENVHATRKMFDGTGCVPWMQLDRGGDAWPVLLEAHAPGSWLTVRASHSRRLRAPAGSEREYLWPKVESSPILGLHTIEVAAGPSTRARDAVLEVRAVEVTLDLRNHQTKVRKPVAVWAVMAKETAASAGDQEPIEWMLLTTYPVSGFAAACTVLKGYSQRWRIEEFHKAWKSGACNLEDMQLEKETGIRALALILAAVATRLLRMTYLARAAPKMLASVEFSPAEIRAAALLAGKRAVRVATVTMFTVTRWIARAGGYIDRKSALPPGLIVLTRGLRRVEAAASALRVQEGIGEPEI
jgi:hypothetical protein